LRVFTGFSDRSIGRLPYDVTAVAASKDGRLFVGTVNGIFTVSGGQVVPLAESSALPDSNISALAAGGRGNLWAANRLGVCRLSGGRWSVYGISDGLPSSDVRALVYGSGDLWAATGAGLAVYRGGRFSVVNQLAMSVLAADDTRIVAAGGTYAYIFSGGKWAVLPTPGGEITGAVVVNGVCGISSSMGYWIAPLSRLGY
jgi:ligand-binding sensor domain-containing protein